MTGAALVTAVFAYFQTRFVLERSAVLSFHQLSKYTQKGFIELIGAILLGYLVILFALDASEKQSRSKTIPVIAAFLLFEMLLVTAFSAHKLGLLQVFFGLKDQRILASCGIAFIVFSFGLLAWRIFCPKLALSGFRMQGLFLLAIVFLLNGVNLDRIISQTYPIRYYIDGRAYSDYSYLLGNSYDNLDEWPRIMEEMAHVRPPHPNRGYFWGYESASRSDLFYLEYNPLCRDRSSKRVVEDEGVKVVLPTRLFLRAFDKYGKPSVPPPQAPPKPADEEDAEETVLAVSSASQFSLSRSLDFNLREYRAYVYAKAHPEEMSRFNDFMNRSCAETP